MKTMQVELIDDEISQGVALRFHVKHQRDLESFPKTTSKRTQGF
jgi:hypothetical protein